MPPFVNQVMFSVVKACQFSSSFGDWKMTDNWFNVGVGVGVGDRVGVG
ncbi:hypothetical protein JJE00_02005, partial [Candidatus Bathyarchaeota archaeon]|nr:hypothetical protein [Candidatus Bathyarchaeota archaeon]